MAGIKKLNNKQFTVSLEDHFLYPKVWDLFPENIKNKYELMKGALLNVEDNRIKQMDAAGIDFQVLSHVEPCLSLVTETSEAINLAREINDYLYKIILRNSTRLGGFAILPMQSPEESAKELERTVKEYGFKGAMINGHENGFYLDDDSYSLLLSTAEKLDVPLYIHPTDPPKEISEKYYQNNEIIITGWAWQPETALHLIKIINKGIFDKYPKLKIIIGHMGELIHFGFTRLNQSLTMGNWILKSYTPKINLHYYFKNNIYVTSSGVFDEPVFRCAKYMIGIDHLMFSVDYPFRDNITATYFLNKLQINDSEKINFAGGNACKVLKLDNKVKHISSINRFEIMKIKLKSKIGRYLISKLIN